MLSEGLKLPGEIVLLLKIQMGLSIDLVSSSTNYWTPTGTRLVTGVLTASQEKGVDCSFMEIVISVQYNVDQASKREASV